MQQREFPWMQALTPPANVGREHVAACKSIGMAARVSLRLKPGGPWSDSWLASRLGVTRGYLSRVLNDKQDMPRWMLEPIAWATGSRLVLQYGELERALSALDKGRCPIETLVEQIRREAAC